MLATRRASYEALLPCSVSGRMEGFITARERNLHCLVPRCETAAVRLQSVVAAIRQVTAVAQPVPERLLDLPRKLDRAGDIFTYGAVGRGRVVQRLGGHRFIPAVGGV